jgi:ABC-2 type transport system ATP-binding protein
MRYGTFRALEDATFRAAKGEVVGLLGPNGAGKTTTMRILTTFLVPSAGTASVAGFDVVKDPLEVRRRIGYLPEQLPLYPSMEVQEYVRFVARARGIDGSRLRDRVEYVVEACGLAEKYHTPVTELSKGFKQRTALAQALVHDPEVVILDEPTTGLDPHQVLDVRRLVRDLAHEKTVVLSTHVLQEASTLADRVIVVSEGRIVGQGTADELLRQCGVAPSVRVRFAGNPEGSRAAVAALPGAAETRDGADDPSVIVLRETADGLPARIGALARDRGWAIEELSRSVGTLEDAFLALTKRSGGHLHAPRNAPAAEQGAAA